MFFFKKKKRSAKKMAMVGILIAVLCSKSNPIFSKILFDSGWTPVSVYFLVLLVMTLFLAVHEFMQIEDGGKWGMTRNDIKGLLLTTLTSGVLSPLLYFEGLKHVTASESVLITSIGPFFIVIFASWFLKEKLTNQTLGGGLFLVAGLLLLIWPDITGADMNIGSCLLLLGAIVGSLSTIIHKKFVQHRHLDSIVLVRSVLSLVVVGIWMLFTEPESFTLLTMDQNVWVVIGLPLMSFLLPFFFYYRSLKHIKAMEAGLMTSTGPIIGVAYGMVFFGETLTSLQFASMFLMVLGILFINVPLTKWRIVPSRLMEIGPLRK